jgi:hypothetical protein
MKRIFFRGTRLNQVTTTTELARAYADGEPVCIEEKRGRDSYIRYGIIHSLEREDWSGHSHNVTMYECSTSGVIDEELVTYHVRFDKTEQ